MRERKYRGWDGLHMTYSPKIGGKLILTPREDLGFLDLNQGLEDLQCNTILMEWMGSKDKTGRDIYEGDIISGCFYGDICVVEWVQEDAGWSPFSRPSFGGCEWESESPKSVTVIGNIYENPELLESVSK